MGMGRLRRTTLVLVAATLALPAAACTRDGPGPSATPSATVPPTAPATSAPATTGPGTPSPAGTASPGARTPAPPTRPPTVVTLRRSGGLAGVAQTVIVLLPGGGWAFQDVRRSGDQRLGRLTADQRRQLQSLLASDELAKEARVERKPVKCNDGFVYRLDTGAQKVGWSDCGDGEEPDTASAIADLLVLWTPM
jgi:hypothetical protein